MDSLRDVVAWLATLSARDQEVMQRVVSGLANKQIAGELGISTKTVEAHRARVMEKMRADSLAELVRLVETSRERFGRSGSPSSPVR
jgi:FixJ family two-component response regulator